MSQLKGVQKGRDELLVSVLARCLCIELSAKRELTVLRSVFFNT